MMNEIEQIEQYLNQQLTGEALLRFKERLKNDPEWQKQVADYRVMFNGFDVLRRENFEAKLRSWNEEQPLEEKQALNDDEPTARQEEGTSGKTRWMYRFAAAASVLIVLAMATWYFSNAESALNQFASEQNTLVAMHIDTERSVSEGQVEQQKFVEEAASDYAEQNYLAGIQKVEKIPTDSPFYLQAQYLLGHSWFQVQDYSKAATAFEKVLAHPEVSSFKSREEASWTYLLSLTQLHLQYPNATNTNRLKTKLSELMKTANPNNIYLKKEQELKRLLEIE